MRLLVVAVAAAAAVGDAVVAGQRRRIARSSGSSGDDRRSATAARLMTGQDSLVTPRPAARVAGRQGRGFAEQRQILRSTGAAAVIP